MTDVPVCAGRGTQAPCKHYEKSAGNQADNPLCLAIYDVVTGAPLVMRCYEARGDQLLCGRHGALYEPVGPRVPNAATRSAMEEARVRLQALANRDRSIAHATREDLG